MASPISPFANDRAKRLKNLTSTPHEALDKRILDAGVFTSRERYVCFLRMQQKFWGDADALYQRDDLKLVLPDLEGRRRIALIERDLQDLDITVADRHAAVLTTNIPLAQALGWVYVAEGSSLGAAVLFKLVQKLGLGPELGARHLAPHPDGVAKHWQTFVKVLNGMHFSEAEELEVEHGARAAFAAARKYVEEELW